MYHQRQWYVPFILKLLLFIHLFNEYLQFSCSVMSNSLLPHGLQHATGFPVRHQLLELTLTHVHQVSDAIEHLMKYLFNLKYFSGTVLRFKEKLTSTDPGQIDLALVAQMLKHLPTMQEAQV